MDKEKLKRQPKKEKKISISIRLSKSLSEWLREGNYSPTAIFIAACKDLGYKNKE